MSTKDVPIADLDLEKRAVMDHVASLARRGEASWKGNYPRADEDGKRRAKHMELPGAVFIPREPEAAGAGLMTFGIILVVLGAVTFLAAFGFSVSVPEFPSGAVLPMVGGGTGALVLGILLIVWHRMRAKAREETVPPDGVYLLENALIVRKGDKVHPFEKDAIKEIAVDISVRGSTGAAGTPGASIEHHRSKIVYVDEQGRESSFTIPLYLYTVLPEPAMQPILEEWLDRR